MAIFIFQSGLWMWRRSKRRRQDAAQFSSRWNQCAQKSPYALHPVSQKFPERRLWNGSSVRLIDDGLLSSIQGRSSCASSFNASLLQAVDAVMFLALCPQAEEGYYIITVAGNGASSRTPRKASWRQSGAGARMMIRQSEKRFQIKEKFPGCPSPEQLQPMRTSPKLFRSEIRKSRCHVWPTS